LRAEFFKICRSKLSALVVSNRGFEPYMSRVYCQIMNTVRKGLLAFDLVAHFN